MDITALLAGLPSDIASRLQTADTGGASFAQAFATASGNSEAISSEAIAADLLAETLPAANREQLSALITQSGNPVPLSDNAPEQISEESGGDEALFAIATMAAPTTAALVTQPATPALTTASGVAGTHLSEPSSAAVANLRSEPPGEPAARRGSATANYRYPSSCDANQFDRPRQRRLQRLALTGNC